MVDGRAGGEIFYPAYQFGRLRGSASVDTIARPGFCKMLSNYQNRSAAARAVRYITKTEARRREPPETGYKPENRSLPAQAGGHRTEDRARRPV